jgi:hypothetical protein
VGRSHQPQRARVTARPGLQGSSSYQITIRFRDDVKASDQVLWADRELNVHGRRRLGTRQWTMITSKQLRAAGRLTFPPKGLPMLTARMITKLLATLRRRPTSAPRARLASDEQRVDLTDGTGRPGAEILPGQGDDRRVGIRRPRPRRRPHRHLRRVLNLTKVKILRIRAATANTNDVVVGGAAANAFLGPFADATDKIAIQARRRGCCLIAPNAGYTVIAGTGDQLKIANSGAGTGVDLHDRDHRLLGMPCRRPFHRAHPRRSRVQAADQAAAGRARQEILRVMHEQGRRELSQRSRAWSRSRLGNRRRRASPGA